MTDHNMSTREMEAFIEQIARKTYRQYLGDYEAGGSGTENIHTLEDLCSAGKIGFMEAENNFDPSRTSQTFKQFAFYKIRFAMLDHIRKEKYKISIPQKKRELIKKWEHIKESRENRQEADKSDMDELEKYGVKFEDIPQIETMRPRYISTSSRIHDDDGESPEFETLLAGKEKTPEEALDRKTIIEIMQYCIENIRNSQDRLILIARYLKEVTLKDLASTLDCSGEKVRLRQKSAEESLKKCMKRHGVTEND